LPISVNFFTFAHLRKYEKKIHHFGEKAYFFFSMGEPYNTTGSGCSFKSTPQLVRGRTCASSKRSSNICEANDTTQSLEK